MNIANTEPIDNISVVPILKIRPQLTLLYLLVLEIRILVVSECFVLVNLKSRESESAKIDNKYLSNFHIPIMYKMYNADRIEIPIMEDIKI